ncbi:DUF3857 domain-containing protein [Puniceicoccaceae bacterium K14]|nr:DUF3857 domain-containing protein [Puniceicoccaceae bacterium K14]
MRLLLFILPLISLLSVASGKGKIPDWLSNAIEQKDAYDRIEPDAKSLVLIDKKEVEYLGGGNVNSYAQYAIHLKSRSERELASAYIPLYNKSQNLKSFKAWLVFPSGKIETFGRKDGYLEARDRDALHSESMAFLLDKTRSITKGDIVFAYEYKVAEKTKFLQEYWFFQLASPTVHSVFELKLPNAWEAKGTIFNSDQIVSTQTDEVYRWEASELPSVNLEEYDRLPHKKLLAQVGITIVPAESKNKEDLSFRFENWQDVSEFGYKTFLRKTKPTLAIQKKADDLVAGSETNWQKIQAISRYAQSLNYMQINVDLNSGGGYEPFDVGKIFERHFGDCKDMSALTIAMLATQGIDAYPVSANVDEEAFVFDSWPSPFQFDHCIVGIPVGKDVVADSIVEVESLGRVLLFDPTNWYTPVGKVPSYLMGGNVLVENGQTNGLAKVPNLGPEHFQVEREIYVKVDHSGGLDGRLRDTLSGRMAGRLRYLYRSLGKEEFDEMLLSWISAQAIETTIGSVKCEDYFEENRFILEIEFSSKYYGRAISRKRMIFSPVFLGRREWVPPSDEPRKSDAVIEPYMLSEKIHFELPENLVLVENPDEFLLETEFANYSLKIGSVENTVIAERKLVEKSFVLPANRYQETVDFFDQLTRAEKRPVVIGFK